MKRIELITEEHEKIVDVLCDICGKSCKDEYDMNYEYSQLIACWGYGSRKDTESWNFNFCEECSDKIRDFIKSLGSKFEVTYYI